MPVIREVAEQSPFDEALQARLLLVLAADGKQAEALAVYERVRSGLAEQLGVDPGPELRAAYNQVLQQGAAVNIPVRMPTVVLSGDAPLSSPGAELAASWMPRREPTDGIGIGSGVRQARALPASLVSPAQVPLRTRFFNGRQKELDRLSDLLSSDGREPTAVVTVAVDGLPGVGKTSLVVYWAHRVAHHFPDGHSL